MENIILPIVTALLFTGATVDITSFEDANLYKTPSIFNETDIIEAPLDVLNASYYVLQDEKLPYSPVGLPVDLAIRLKKMDPATETKGVLKSLDFRGYDSVAVLFVAEYKKFERRVRDNAVPLPNWQEKLEKGRTHYVDKTYYGGKYIALAQVSSNVTGDVQIIRKKLTEIMGVSGRITKDSHDVWTNALQNVASDPELRGKMQYWNFETASVGVKFPKAAESFYTFLKYLPDISSYVVPDKIIAPQREDRFIPLSVSLKSLHVLDKHYPAVEKNLETERYLKKADDLWEDLSHANEKTFSLIRLHGIAEDGQGLYKPFIKKIQDAQKVFKDLRFRNANVYQKINATAYDAAFQSYYSGLDKGTDNYYVALLKIFQDNYVQCSTGFLKPTRGILRVQANDISKKGFVKGGLEECLQYCLRDYRCRAIGYNDVTQTPLFGGNRNLCFLYYRNTGTAKIGVPIRPFIEMVIYDRHCKYIRP